MKCNEGVLNGLPVKCMNVNDDNHQIQTQGWLPAAATASSLPFPSSSLFPAMNVHTERCITATHWRFIQLALALHSDVT